MTRIADLDPRDFALPRALADELLSPSLVIHLDRVRQNLASMLRYCGGDAERWRPHVKTTKIPEVQAELARAGIRNFKCATTREARVLADVLAAEGVKGGDVLLAYPLVGPALAHYARIAATHPAIRFSVLCESAAAVAEVPSPLGVFLDLNPGMDRTGAPLESHDEILEAARAAGARLRGLHCYDGHRHDADHEVRRQRAFDDYTRLLALVEELERASVAIPEIVTCGTPAFRLALEFAPFQAAGRPQHRVSPGTVVFHDLRTEEENPDLDLAPAAFVFARIVSHPRPSVATCDAGSKALAAEAGDPCAFVLGHQELRPRTPNEEHLPLDVLEGPAPPRGTELLLVPRHVCPTVNLAEEAVLLDGGDLRAIVPVRARAHETLPR